MQKPEHTSDCHDGRPVPGCGACVWEEAVETTLEAVREAIEVKRTPSYHRMLAEVREQVK